jgi:hypothetical protein
MNVTFRGVHCDNCGCGKAVSVRLRLKRDGTHAETRFRLSAKRTESI